jgi:hypothetical protein
VRKRLPHPQRQIAFVLQPLEQAEVPEPAVLVVHRSHAARRREPDAGAHGLEPFVLADELEHEPAPKLPGRLLA